MEYYKEVIEKYNSKLNNVILNMKKDNLFPDRKEPIKSLDPASEFLLKATYSLKVGFLQEFTFLFAYIYSKQKFEQLVIDLEEQGYLKSAATKDYGKCWTLTKTALYYLTTDGSIPLADLNIKDDTVAEGKLTFYKELNGFVCNQVFTELTLSLYTQYKNEGSAFRKSYGKKQYIAQYIAPEQNIPCTKQAIQTFSEEYLPTFLSDEEVKSKYRAFVKSFKIAAQDNPIYFFAFLKDYYNSLGHTKEEAVREASKLFFGQSNSFFRHTNHTFQGNLCKLTNSKQLLQDYEYYVRNEVITQLKINRRNLLNTKAPEKSKEAIEKINSLDYAIADLSKQNEVLLPHFEAMVFDKYGDNDMALYTPATITLDSLKSMCVHITGIQKMENGKLIIHWGIFQPNQEPFSISALFTRLERIYQFMRLALPSCSYDLTIYTHTPKQAENLQPKLKTLKEDFKELGSYGILLLAFDELAIKSTQMQMKERYEVFRQLKEQAKTF